MPHEDHRTTITIPGELLELLDQVRARQLLPKGEGLRKDNAALIWLATQHARQLLAAPEPPAKLRRK